MSFGMSLANATMFTTYAVYQVISLGLTPLQLLLIGAVLEGTVLLFEGITGIIADVYSRRLSVIIGVFVLGFGFVLEGSAIWLGESIPLLSAFVWLLLSQVFFGIGHTFVSGADTAWIVDEVGEERIGPVFMKAKRYGLIGTLIGIVLSVGLSMLITNLPYLIGGLMYVVLGVLLVFGMKETAFVRPEAASKKTHWRHMRQTWLSGAGVIRRQPVLLLILLATLFGGAAAEGYDRLWQAHLIQGIGFPEHIPLTAAGWLGLFALASTLIGLVIMWITEQKLDIDNKRTAMFGLILLLLLRIGAIVLLVAAPDFAWAVTAVLLLDLVMILNEPIYNTWLNYNIQGRTRATVLSMLSQSDALGQTAGGAAIGWIGSRFSLRASLVAAAMLLTPVLAVYSRIWTRDRQPPSSRSADM
ncbi:MFS transporter [Paenibacillus sp. JX-17]|uniref:MFS transporter n=1 Tax=Paenibacillus lacisoli TaxID=3064525 RepID=A0ABT9C7Y1_9BACL|nr:MFS transporter [Paenibacillus sp. JX-17]MDO7905369.1 MFS transporter [Paenibacillus sp. JX-17]